MVKQFLLKRLSIWTPSLSMWSHYFHGPINQESQPHKYLMNPDIYFIVRCMVKQRHLSGVVIMTALNSQAQREQILCKKHNIEALNKIFSITGTVTVSHLLDQLCNIKTLWFPWCSRAKPNLSTHHCALFYFNTGIDSFFQPSCAFKQCFITSPCSLCSVKTSLHYNMTEWLFHSDNHHHCSYCWWLFYCSQCVPKLNIPMERHQETNASTTHNCIVANLRWLSNWNKRNIYCCLL